MESAIRITRETEFYQGYIRLKMAVTNESSYSIIDITLDFIYDDEILRIDRHEPPSLPVKQGKYILGNIDGGKSKSIAILFDPVMCSKGTDINCHVSYKDYQGKLKIIQMEPKEISVVCPIMKTDQDINIGRLKEFITNLPRKDSRVYEVRSSFDVKNLATLAREVVEKHDVRHIRTLHTRDDKTCEIWYYGRTKINHDDIVIRISIFTEYQTMELFAATHSAEVLTGLLAEVGRDLKDVVEDKASGRGRVLNVHIKDSVVQRSNLLDMCDMDGNCDVNIVIEDSVVQRSNIAYVDEETRLRQEQEKREEAERKRIPKKKMMFIPVIIIIVLVGYWMFSPLLADNSNNQDTVVPQSTEVVNSSLVAAEATADTATVFAGPQEGDNTYTNSIGMEFVLIPAGEFMMGSDDGDYDEKPVHKVAIGQAYYLGKYEVTQEQWVEVMGDNPSSYKGDSNPVEDVSWNDVQEFVKKLNAKEGTDKYRLPTEAEWEYACRAGTTTKYSFGDDESKLGDYAWHYDNSEGETHPVGQKKPNLWGLYDIYGNVGEWCQDNRYTRYEGAPTDGSAWEDGKTSIRIYRGGSWSSNAWDCRSAVRYCSIQERGSYLCGFRLLVEA